MKSLLTQSHAFRVDITDFKPEPRSFICSSQVGLSQEEELLLRYSSHVS